MTQVVIGDILPYTQATATSGQTVFTTNWTANAASDIVVYYTPLNTTPNDVTQVLNSTQFSVAFIGSPLDVQVTLVTPATNTGDIVTITRQTPADRMNLYINTNFTPDMLNQDFGILTLVDQQAQLVDQKVAPRYNYSSTIVDVKDTILPILGANQGWVKNSGNTAIAAYTFPTNGIAPSDDTYVTMTDETATLPNSVNFAGKSNGITILSTGHFLTRSFAGTADQIAIANPDGTSGNITASIVSNPIMPGTAGMGIPSGTTGQRVTPTSNIGFRYNTTLQDLEYYNGSAWIQLQDGNFSGIPIVLEAANSQVPDGFVLTAGSGVTLTPGVGTLTVAATGLGGTVTSVSSGNLSPLFTTSVATATTTPALSFALSNAAANTYFGNATGLSAAPSYTSAGALTKTDDTNVTLSLGGSPTVALLAATSLTLGWTGLLSLARGGTNKNITPVAGGVFWSDADSFELTAAGTSGQLFQSTGTTAPGWTTATYPTTGGTAGSIVISDGTNKINSTSLWPNTVGSAGQMIRSDGTTNAYTTATFADTYAASVLLYSNGANAVTGLATANSGVLITSAGGVPSISSTLPTAVQGNITQLGSQSQALNMNSHLINNVTDPVSAQDAATMAYVLAVAQGRTYKDPCVAATTANFSAVYSNGTSGVGATLIGTVMAAFAPDGVTLAVGDRVLFKDQSSSFQNGIYTTTTLGTGAVLPVFTRALDMDSAAEFKGATTFILGGTIQAGQTWTETATVVTVGTDAVTFAQTGDETGVTSVTAGTGLSGGVITSTGTISLTAPVTLALGGTNNAAISASAGGIVWSDATKLNILAGTATANQLLLSGNAVTPAWSTSTYPTTNAINTLLYASSANTMAALSTANSGLLVTSSGGVPSILAGPGTTGNLLQSNAAAAPSFSTSTYPSTNAINTLLYASSANVMAALATANSSVLITSSGGVPSLSTTLPSGISATNFTMTTPILGTPQSGNLSNCTGLPAPALPTGTIFNTQQGVLTTTTSTASFGTFVDTGITVTITPTSASNTVLVRAVICGYAAANECMGLRLVRGSTAIGVGTSASSRTPVGTTIGDPGGVTQMLSAVMEWLDSPATTSATTYKVQYTCTQGNATVYINRTATDTDISQYPRAVSTITVSEVKV